MPWNIAALARPVRIAVNSSLVTSTDLLIRSSASFRMLGVSSLTDAPRSRGWSSPLSRTVKCGWAGPSLRDDGADPVAAHGAGDVARLVEPEDHHLLGVVHAQAEGGGVHDLESLLEGVGVGDVLELLRVGVAAGIGVV